MAYLLDDRATLLPLATKLLISRTLIIQYFFASLFKFFFEDILCSITPVPHSSLRYPAILIDNDKCREDLLRLENSILETFPNKYFKISFYTIRKFSFSLQRLYLFLLYLVNSSCTIKYSRALLRRTNRGYLLFLVLLANSFRLSYLHATEKYSVNLSSKIEFLFCFKDMNSIQNSFIQFLRKYSPDISTYTTQHASYRKLSEVGPYLLNDLNVLTLVSEYFLSWGSYVSEIVSNNSSSIPILSGPPAIELPARFEYNQISIIHDNIQSATTNKELDSFAYSIKGEAMFLQFSFHPSELPRNQIVAPLASRTLGKIIIGRNSNLVALCCFYLETEVYLHESSVFLDIIGVNYNTVLQSSFSPMLTKKFKSLLLLSLFNYNGPLFSLANPYNSKYAITTSYFDVISSCIN